MARKINSYQDTSLFSSITSFEAMSKFDTPNLFNLFYPSITFFVNVYLEGIMLLQLNGWLVLTKHLQITMCCHFPYWVFTKVQ